MLPFGSLFTQLPLLVIGVLYMLYLGLSAVNKETPDLSKEIKQADLQTINTGNAIDYFTLVAVSLNSSADKPEMFFPTLSNCFSQSFVFLDNDFPISSFYDAHIFARPPPKS